MRIRRALQLPRVGRAEQSFGESRSSRLTQSIPRPGLSGHTVTNPLYAHGYAHDVSIILLDNAVSGVTSAGLPPVGLLDEMKKTGAIDTTYTNVGYGTHEKVKNAGGPADFPFDGDRHAGSPRLPRALSGAELID